MERFNVMKLPHLLSAYATIPGYHLWLLLAVRM